MSGAVLFPRGRMRHRCADVVIAWNLLLYGGPALFQNDFSDCSEKASVPKARFLC